MGRSLYLSQSTKSLTRCSNLWKGHALLFDIPFIADWNKIGIIGNAKLIATQDVKTRHVLIGITKLAAKYLCIKMAFSTKQRANMTVILGPSRQFIRMEQSGFNAEQNQNV